MKSVGVTILMAWMVPVAVVANTTLTWIPGSSVIRHEHPGMVDVAPLIAAAGDMPDGTWKLETNLTGHGARRKER